MHRARLILTLAGLLTAGAACAARVDPAGVPATGLVAFTHVTLIDGRGGPPVRDVTVVVEGSRIRAVGPSAALAAPPGARVMDASGQFMIPGLWDMHVHLAKAGEASLPLFIANGVTSVRDMGGDFARVGAWRGEVASGSRVGPWIRTSGPMLESASNVARMLREQTVEPVAHFRAPVAGAADAERVVDSVARLGVDFIKVRTVASDEAYLAIAEAARRRGLPLAGHPVAGPDRLLQAAQRSIEHTLYPGLAGLPDSAQRRVMARLASAGVIAVPTLVNGEQSLFLPDSVATPLLGDRDGCLDPRRRYVGGYLLTDWAEQVAERRGEPPLDWAAIAPRPIQMQRRLRAAGVRVLPGTDVGVAFIYPGFSLHDELELLVRALGFTPAEAIVAATRHPAEFFGVADSVGTIAAGMRADLVLLASDPLADIRNTARIAAVMQGGRLYPRGALDGLLRGAERSAHDGALALPCRPGG